MKTRGTNLLNMSIPRLFGLSVLCTMGAVLMYLFVKHQIDLRREPKLQKIAGRVYLTSQLKPDDMRFLRRNRIKTIVDLRPDGEAADQPSSDEMRTAAMEARMEFHYIPVPHENIPEKAVDSLKGVLDENRSSMVLYCRTGRRAVRLFALASASQSDGPNAEEILKVVRSANFSADDLTENIKQRIAKRNTQQSDQKP